MTAVNKLCTVLLMLIAVVMAIVYMCYKPVYGSTNRNHDAYYADVNDQKGRPVVGGGSVEGYGSTSPGNVGSHLNFNSSVLDDSLWNDSAETKQYYDTQNPSTLTNLMPGSWNSGTDKSDCTTEDSSEFARFSVSPKALKKSEDIRGFMRLWEETRSPSGRITGQISLLRNAVTPLKNPIPIGDTQFTFNDSQGRQDLIAAAVGDYPTDTSC
jgi:hypothetical protein